MKERQIPFSGAMVRALLEGRKGQTRRVVTPQPPVECGIHYMLGDESWLAPEDRKPLRHSWEAWHGPLFENRPKDHLCGSHCVKSPYGAPGDRLWVREAWRTTGDGGRCDDMAPRELQPYQVWYEADGAAPADECVGKYRPSMFMPRWASRITLEVTGMRVERLQEIGEADAIAEGIEQTSDGFSVDGGRHFHAASARMSYASLWDSLNDARGYSWDGNPWVWVVEFKRIAL